MEEKMIAIKKIIAVGGVLLGTAGIVHAYLRTAPSKAAREFTDLAEDLLKGTEPAKGRFTEADIATLPCPVRVPLRSECGSSGLHPLGGNRRAPCQGGDYGIRYHCGRDFHVQ